MTPEERAYFSASATWAEVRRPIFGDGRARPHSPVHIGSRVDGRFAADLLELGWKPAVLLDEENTIRGRKR